jgi:PII-like signaling protein
MISAVGPREALLATLRAIGEELPEAVATLERVAFVKHDGALLEPLPRVGAAGFEVWQAVRVLSRRTARVSGRALFSELTRRLRTAGAAGATTILGDWGFSSDEEPHGDKLGRVASHRPTATVVIDRPAAIASLWPLIDEVTAQHGSVVSSFVPGYRERAGATVHGDLGGVLGPTATT